MEIKSLKRLKLWISICATAFAILSCATIPNPAKKPPMNAGDGASKSSPGDPTYGYSKDNPILCGGGPEGEIIFLSSLTGPNGEKVEFIRLGSCCPFETPNSPFKRGLLDMYKVSYEGQKEEAILYLNMYDKAPIQDIYGFKRKVTDGL